MNCEKVTFMYSLERGSHDLPRTIECCIEAERNVHGIMLITRVSDSDGQEYFPTKAELVNIKEALSKKLGA